MGSKLKDLQNKFKAFTVTRFLHVEKSKRKASQKNHSWMTPISHGFHVIEDRSIREESGYLDSESVLIRREEIQDQEVWMFGVFNPQTGDAVTGYLQSHLFDKKLNENQFRSKTKETLRKAYSSTRTKLHEGERENETRTTMGSTYAIVINGEKVVAAYMADYRAIICRDGVAHLVGKRHSRRAKRQWSFGLVQGAWHMPKVRVLAYENGNTGSKPSTSGAVVGVENINSDAEFLILASNGIWEVMNNQEAVNLIRHIDDPQEAAECLAKEASTRMSRSQISCLVIRFD